MTPEVLVQFMNSIDMSNVGGCWIWTGGRTRRYPRLRTLRAHRLSHEHFVGPIPDGMEIDHLCRNTLCVNPAHLEAVTRTENLRRQGAARTHCKHGHPYEDGSTRLALNPRGYWRRVCRVCDRERARSKYWALRSEPRVVADVASPRGGSEADSTSPSLPTQPLGGDGDYGDSSPPEQSP